MKRLDDIGTLVERLGPGRTAVLHSGCAEPPRLAAMLAEHAAALSGTRVLTMMPMGEAPWAQPPATEHLQVDTFFPGRALRRALDAGRARPLRHTLSELPRLFEHGGQKADVLLLQTSPPDEHGEVSLGVSVDYMPAVLAQAGRPPCVVAEIQPAMPRTAGASRLPVSRIDAFIEADPARPGPLAVPPAQPDETDRRIARHVAALLRDGLVLQIGIGSLPDAVLGALGHLRGLGLHSGIVTDAIRPLVETGVIDRGVGICTMAAGTQAFYDWLHDNPAIEFHPCAFTHDASRLASIDGLAAINGALQVDLAGRINAERVAGRIVAMPGGLPDFAVGATRSRGGLSIVALRASFGAAGEGLVGSNVVASLAADALPTLPAEAVDYVVTEHGVAAIRGVPPERRAAGLIGIADPRHREALARAWHDGAHGAAPSSNGA